MSDSRLRRIATMLALVVGGEAIFGLPFHIARFFRPTLLAAFGLNNTELGALFSAYGVVAMISYFPGGPLADKFSARRLMTLSLLLTAGTGFYMATLPGMVGLTLVFAFFGCTTILLFWAAMIRATRDWGGADAQGTAFGLLDGGRGLFAVVLAQLALIPFGWAFEGDPTNATDEQRLLAIRTLIYIYTTSTFIAAIFVWFAVPERRSAGGAAKFELKHIGQAFRLPSVWVQGLLVICAYTAYKGTDFYSLYAFQVYGLNEVDGAQLSVIATWTRPVAAVGAGLLANKISPTRAAQGCFSLLIVGYLSFVFVPVDKSVPIVMWINVIATCGAIFGLRGVYFAIMEEVDIPPLITGTAVGLISVIGFTPDIFVSPAGGWLIDRNPGEVGFGHMFIALTVFSVIGLAASIVAGRFNPSRS